MQISATHNFVPGRAYLVAHRECANPGAFNSSRNVRRIFKGMETRHGAIPCAVFSSRVGPNTSAVYDEESKTLAFRGLHIPQSEVSIPHYDLVAVEPV